MNGRVETRRPFDLALVAGIAVIAALTLFVTLSIAALAVGTGF